MDQDLERLLVSSHLRVTAARRAVFRALKTASAPLSHVEITKLCSEIDKTSVYRTIELFIRLGVVVGVSHGWKQRYELAAPYRPHHHHLYCVNCSRTEELQSEKLEAAIRDLAGTSNFEIQEHTFEATGLCNECRS
jgi:Fe2+ or Zn2+ uptake regulation protein